VKNAALGLAMIATQNRFWGAFGNGMRAGVRDGKPICDLCQHRSGRVWLKSTILSALSERKLTFDLESGRYLQHLIRKVDPQGFCHKRIKNCDIQIK
jgi:hypothetical protein